MRVLIPLAGSDFIGDDGSLKALQPLSGQPLLLHTLQTRPWYKDIKPQNYSFVFYDSQTTRAFAKHKLADWFPGSKATFISHHTRGAAISTLGALMLGHDHNTPIIVDLADIVYRSTLDPFREFQSDNLGGIALVFNSDDPKYSYLKTNSQGQFVEAAEKQAISRNASAGTYLFSDSATYLRALAHALDNAESQTYRDLFFVCPLFNGVKNQDKTIKLETVFDIIDIKVVAPKE